MRTSDLRVKVNSVGVPTIYVSSHFKIRGLSVIALFWNRNRKTSDAVATETPWHRGEAEPGSWQHGDFNIHRRGEKENPDTAAGGVRGGGPGRAAAGGGGHGEAGPGEGNTGHSTSRYQYETRKNNQLLDGEELWNK